MEALVAEIGMNNDGGSTYSRAHVRAIDALIPMAEDAANDAVGGVENADKPENAATWTRAFHLEMDRLAAAQGLRRASWQGAGR